MTDYLKFWNVAEPVFVRPAPGSALFVPPTLAPHLTRLALFAGQEQSLTLITGEAGTGKSAVLRWLGQMVPGATHEFLLVALGRKETAAGWLAPRLAEFLAGGAAERKGREGREAADDQQEAADLRRAVTLLDDLVEEGRRLVVAVDGAHFAATPAALSELSLLLSLEAHTGGCLSIVLAGDTSLAATVAATPELAQRVVFHLELTRWDRANTSAYIEHRCRLAAITSPFDLDALAILHARTRGFAAAVNAFAEHCLVEAAIRGARVVDGDLANAVASQMTLPEPAAALGTSSQPTPTLPFATVGAERSAVGTPAPAIGKGAPLPQPAATPRGEAKGPIKLSSLFKTDDDPKKG